jgi:hypothetical protein
MLTGGVKLTECGGCWRLEFQERCRERRGNSEPSRAFSGLYGGEDWL